MVLDSAQKTKKVAFIGSGLITILSLLDSSFDDALVQRFRLASKRCDRSLLESVPVHLADEEFRRAFCSSRSSFYILVSILRRHLLRDADQAKRSSDGVISPCIRLAVTLRMISGARTLTRCWHFAWVGLQFTLYFVETVLVIVDELKMPGVPVNDSAELKKLADDFRCSRSAPSLLYGSVRAIDGIAIAITKPPDECAQRKLYCRKGKCSLPVQAVVDASYCFLYMSSRCVGSTHDSVALSASSLAYRLREGELPFGYLIAADAAYL